MTWSRQAPSSFIWMGRGESSYSEPGQPPTRFAYLPAMEVMKSSTDACAQALSIPRVALLFLTTGDLYHEETWRLWLKSAGGMIPAQSMVSSVCKTEGASARLQEAAAACHDNALEPPSTKNNNNKNSSSTTGNGGGFNVNVSVIDQQHLFSVYVHAPPSFDGYPAGSLWAGRLIKHRVRTSWGEHTLVEATRHLLWEAFRDPLNTRFLLISESDIPIYDPLTLWQQLQAESHSRLDTCKHQNTSPWRWDPRMETARMRFFHWRKSPQWMSMTRDHAAVVLRDEEVFRKFEKHCWSAWDDRNNRWHRECFSDEHYFATLLAVEGRDEEGLCGTRGVSYTEWEGESAHPKSFGPDVVDADLFRRARGAPLTATGGRTPPCDWQAAQQGAAVLFVPKDRALGAQSVDLCGRMWRDNAKFAAKMPETCFLTARKFPEESKNRVRDVFLQCGSGIGLLREDVCEAEGGRPCNSFFGRVKSLFSRDAC